MLGVYIAQAVFERQYKWAQESAKRAADKHAEEVNRMIALAEAQRAGRVIDVECRIIPDVLPLPGPAPRLPNMP